MRLTITQCLFGWILLCVIQVDHMLQAQTLVKSRIFMATKKHYASRLPVLANSSVSSKANNLKSAFSKPREKSSTETAIRSHHEKNFFQPYHPNANDHQPYSGKEFSSHNDNRPLTLTRKMYTHLKSDPGSVLENKNNIISPFNLVRNLPRPHKQQMITDEGNAHQRIFSFQPKLRFARDAQEVDKLLNNDDNNTNFYNSNGTTTTVNNITDQSTSTDNNIRDQSTKIINNIKNLTTTTINNITIQTTTTAKNVNNQTTTKVNKPDEQSNRINYNDSNTNLDSIKVSTSSNLIEHEDLNLAMTTKFTNIIPQFPNIRDIPLDPTLLEPTAETIFQTPIIDDMLTTIQMDSTEMMDSSTITSTSYSSTHQHQGISEPSEEKSFKNEKQIPNVFSFDKSPDVGAVFTPQISLPDNNKNGTKNSFDDITLKISLSSSGDSMVVNWIFATNITHISGFQVSYKMSNRENYDSSSLDVAVRSFTIHSLHTDEEYIICVHAIANNTEVKKSCAEWSKSSMKIIVGIVAGCIVIFPLIGILIYILRKDYRMKHKSRYHELADDLACEKYDHIEKCVETDDRKVDCKVCTGTSMKTSLTNSQHDAGHENPCQNAANDTTDDYDNKSGPLKILSNLDVDDEKGHSLHGDLLPHSLATVSNRKNLNVSSNSLGSSGRSSYENINKAENPPTLEEKI